MSIGLLQRIDRNVDSLRQSADQQQILQLNTLNRIGDLSTSLEGHTSSILEEIGAVDQDLMAIKKVAKPNLTK